MGWAFFFFSINFSSHYPPFFCLFFFFFFYLVSFSRINEFPLSIMYSKALFFSLFLSP